MENGGTLPFKAGTAKDAGGGPTGIAFCVSLPTKPADVLAVIPPAAN